MTQNNIIIIYISLNFTGSKELDPLRGLGETQVQHVDAS